MAANPAATSILTLCTSLLSSLSCAIQNVNSLNISTNCPKQLKKVNAIVSLDSDIIFLSDTRLNTGKRGECTDLNNCFLYSQNKQYNHYHNSKGSNRGVSILVSTHLDINIVETFRDDNDNVLGVLCDHNGSKLLLIAIYGPNTNTNAHEFFNSVNRCIVSLKHDGCIIGGDWNATYSTMDSVHNIDIHNMIAPPSITRSLLLADTCAQHNMSDPFRILYPERRDFTYQPRTRRNNRSRLDFFLVSDSIMDSVCECSIPAEIKTELFDHKPSLIHFGKENIKQRTKINNNIFMHDRIMDVVAAHTVDTYLHHAATDNNIITEMRTQVGNLLSLLRDINDCELDIALNGVTPQKTLQLAGLRTLLEEGRNAYISEDTLNELPLNCDDNIFFEVLIGNLKNCIISFQAVQRKIENIKIHTLSSRINRLRDDFLANHQVICDLETELNGIVEQNIRKKV